MPLWLLGFERADESPDSRCSMIIVASLPPTFSGATFLDPDAEVIAGSIREILLHSQIPFGRLKSTHAPA